MIERQGCKVSIRRQCELLCITRSVLYYTRRGPSSWDLAVMRLIDEQYTRTPFYGVERMTAWLRRAGVVVGHNRVRRLMRLMGLEAIYPKPRLSLPGDDGSRKYPYLLGGLKIERPNQVWAADITYVRLWQGFVYLVAIMDWCSRYVLSWALSTTLDVQFCLEALREALAMTKPQVFNTDQGSQFASGAFTAVLQDAGVAISMDGKGRVFDNIFVERLWRTVKYEEICLKDYHDVDEARGGIGAYFRFYNCRRLHQALDYRTPGEIYFGQVEPASAVLDNSVADVLQLAGV